MSVFHNSSRTIQIDHLKRTGSYTMTAHHAHDDYELYYLLAGERDFFIRDRTFRVKSGSFVFVDKDELHRTVDTGIPDHERVVINFAEPVLAGIPLQGCSGVTVLPPMQQYRGEALALELIDEAKKSTVGRDAMLEALLRQLLLMVFRAQAEAPDSGGLPSPLHRTMSEVAAYVGTHFREELSLKRVAERFYFSPYYLSRKFRQCTGFGFAEYVQHVRIREAQRLLRETSLKMIEVSEQAGIGPVAHFHKLFKRMNGCSPLQYRKRQQALPTADKAHG